MPSQGHVKRRSTTESVDKPVKRTRVSRACDQCRIAREKCDGLQPICSTCSGSKRKCAYTANPKKRGIQPGYIRSLELALAFLFQQNPENETSLNEKLEREGALSLLLSRDSKESKKLHKRWRKSKFYSDIDKLLSGEETSRLDNSENFSLHSDDDDSDTEEISLKANESEQNLGNVPQVEPGPLFQMDQQLPIQPTCPAQAKTVPSLPPDSWKLLDTHFTYTQSWLPISEKYDVLKLLYSYPTQGPSPVFTQLDSGVHAELWSILAMGSLYDEMKSGIDEDPSTQHTTAEQLYDTARSFIPNEFGSFDLGHIKAYLNLAVFNITQAVPEAAWILLGCACRVLEGGNRSKFIENPRYKHVFSGCFLVDNMLAVQLNRRPHFQMCDLQVVGKIEEDGIEEWQPWNEQSATVSSGHQTPILGLSTFNNLLQIADILASNEHTLTRTGEYDIGSRLRLWRGSLPSKLNYILSSSALVTPLNPPAVLLNMTYSCAALVSTESASWLHRILDLLEQFQERIGSTCVPPLVNCIMAFIQRQIVRLPLDDATQNRLQTIQFGLLQAQARRSKDRVQLQDTPNTSSIQSVATVQISTPSSLQFPLSMVQPIGQQAATDMPYPTSPQTGNLIPGPDPSVPSYRPFDPLLITPIDPPSNLPYSEVTGELESFFDELASLDRITKLSNQPQFMQNLGFAPDASTADLFLDHIPIQSETFMESDVADARPFDHYDLYRAS